MPYIQNEIFLLIFILIFDSFFLEFSLFTIFSGQNGRSVRQYEFFEVRMAGAHVIMLFGVKVTGAYFSIFFGEKMA